MPPLSSISDSRCSTNHRSKSSWRDTSRSSRMRKSVKTWSPTKVTKRNVRQERESSLSCVPHKLTRLQETQGSWKNGYKRVCKTGRRITLSRRTGREETLSLSIRKLKSITNLHSPRLKRLQKRSRTGYSSSKGHLRHNTVSVLESKKKMLRELSLKAFKKVALL